MKKEKERENMMDIHFTVGITPIIPSFGNDDIVHVSVSKDNSRKGTPSPSKV
jgi:hypothetical protein